VYIGLVRETPWFPDNSILNRNFMDSGQGDLFNSTDQADSNAVWQFSEAEMLAIAALHSDDAFDVSVLPGKSARLYELSVNAFNAILHARMSELPISMAISGFEKKILAAADAAGRAVNSGAAAGREMTESAMRRAAGLAAEDRGDSDAYTVYEAAYKVWHEINRVKGLLRFSPGEDGVYIALCAPDHFVLPALASHFKKRFGGAPWTIIDEKRLLRLRYLPKKPFEFFRLKEIPESIKKTAGGEWEKLWKQYHKTINNESRNNPELQRKLLPQRYWKYLPEMQDKQ
jgi:hypothetical protein